MKPSNNNVLNYYKQLINQKKYQISCLEKQLTDLLFAHAKTLYYLHEFPSDDSLNDFQVIHQKLLNLYCDLLKLQDKYYDIKGKEGFVHEC